MIKKKLLLIGNGDIKNHYKRFELDQLRKYFNLFSFDCSYLIYKKKITKINSKNLLQKNKIKIAQEKIKNKKEFLSKFIHLKPDYVIDGIQSEFTNALKSKVKFNFKFVVFNDSIVNWNINYFKIINLYFLKSFFNHLKIKIFQILKFKNLNYIYDIGFFAGEDCKKLLSYKNTKDVFWIGSQDYYKNYEKKKIKNKNNLITYIDSNIYLNPEIKYLDNKSQNLNFKNLQNHFQKIFEIIESQTNLKVVVALHPNPKLLRNFDNYSLFKRKIYKNKTIELIKKSKLVISDLSTAVNFAVLNYKPIVFAYNNRIKSHKLYENLVANSNFLGSSVINSDENLKNFTINYSVNYKKYNNFKNLFINNTNTHKEFKTSEFIKKYLDLC